MRIFPVGVMGVSVEIHDNLVQAASASIFPKNRMIFWDVPFLL
jgi:hypothetical protein